MNDKHPIETTDEMRQATDTARRQALQKACAPLHQHRADAETRCFDAEPGWQGGVEWTLLWIENTSGQPTEGRP